MQSAKTHCCIIYLPPASGHKLLEFGCRQLCCFHCLNIFVKPSVLKTFSHLHSLSGKRKTKNIPGININVYGQLTKVIIHTYFVSLKIQMWGYREQYSREHFFVWKCQSLGLFEDTYLFLTSDKSNYKHRTLFS